MKLLYAEDEAAMSEAVVDILTYHNYMVDPVYDGEEAQELAAQVYAGEREEGQVSRFRYLRREAPQGGVTVVFLDTSEEVFSYIRVLLLSAAAGLGCWGLMLVFVILLSRRSIRPIAESIERQKQFVTNAGHEIKTPLTIIQSNAEALELYLGESKWSRNIKEQTRRLGGLMQDLLTLARMDEGAAPAQKAALSLSGLAEQALEPFLQPMEAQGITLERDIQPGVSLTADPAQLEQLLSLLLDNAVKYTGPGGRIRLSVKQEGKRARLCLENTCPQLPTVPPEKLFDRFYRGGRRPHPEGGRLWHWPGGGPLPGPGKPGQPARPVPSAPGHPVCGAIPQLNTQNTRTDRDPRPVFFSSKLWLRFGSVYWAAHTERS